MLDSRFEIFDDIGSGTIAHVFRAWDHRLQRIVAVKILDRPIAGDAGAIAAFEGAARAAAGLPPHRNIVFVYEVGWDGDLPYVVTEFVQGKNLKELIAVEAPFAIDRALEIARQAARGLEFAHQHGLVHGGLKPRDILISRAGDVKLTDFGYASVAEAGETDQTRNLATGTGYRSPEQMSGEAARASSDIYALGVVLYEMLTGVLPFQADTPVELAAKQAREEPRDPGELNSAVSPALRSIVLQALARQPGERYRSVAALAEALHQYQRHQKGDTPLYFYPSQQVQAPNKPQARPLNGPQAQASGAGRVVPVARPRLATTPRRWTLMSLVFLAVVVIAGAGGLLAYRAISRVLNPSKSAAPPPRRHVTHPVAGATRAGRPPAGARATSPKRVAGGCTAHHIGPVRLVRIWAESVQTRPGTPVTFDYTVANDSSECRDVFLGLTVYGDAQPGSALSDASGDKVVGALPGVHMYKRQFTFPSSAAGQRFDVVWSVADPSRAHPWGLVRVNHLITVGS